MNTITKEIILERLNRFKNRVDELGGTTSKIVCKEAATEKEILELEKELANKLPEDFRWVLLNVSSHLEFFWNLYREDEELLELPKELVEIFRAICTSELILSLAAKKAERAGLIFVILITIIHMIKSFTIN